MSQRDSGFRNISDNHLGDNVTIHQGDVHNYASDQDNQCLRDLRSTDPRHDKLRIQDTKGGLLKDSYRWILENEDFKDWRDSAQNRILWIKGNPGKGKTMLLCGIIDELAPMTKLAKSADPTMNTIFLSYFFCQGSNARINNATAVLRGLIYLLIVQEPSLISHVQGKYKHAGEDLFSDENAWVALSEIFVAILHDSKVEEVILVIDALDECETDLSKLLDTIVRQFTFSPIKCIISSRNVLHIQQMLEAYIPRGILSLELKGNAACVSEAVDAYIKDRVSRLRSIQNDQGRQDELCKKIQEKAQGTFLWASLVVSKIEQVQVWEIMKVVEKMPMGLTALYKRMVDQIDNLEEENGDLCRNMLSTMITAYNPPSLAEVGVLAGLPDQISENSEWIEALVTMCGSFLTLNEGHVYFIHQSAKDFLSTEIHSADAARRHLDVFERSVAAISRLPKNIYGLTDFGVRPKDAQPPEPNPLDSMRYSCFYWANHLCDACAANTKNEAQVIITETLEPLLKSYFLRWIESLSLLGGLTVGLHSIRKLLHELPHDANTQLARFLSNLETFVLRNGVIIAQAPLQVYGTALIFSPLHDDIKASLWNERLSFIKDIRGIRKSAFLQTLKGHYRGAVGALAFSCNSAMLAIKARSGQLHCWEVATGVLKWMIPYYDVGPSAIVFSPDNRTLLLAACRDPIQESTRKNPREKGGENISYWITYIALSPDNGMPETSCSSRKIRLEEPAPNHQDDGLVFSFAFSLDCNALAAGWRSGSITLWDTTTGLLRQTIQGHEGETQDIAVSPDGGKIVSRSYDEIRLWDATTGDLLNEFEKFEGEILFLSDGMRIQMGSRIYDMTTGTVQPCIDNYASKIAISPDDKILAVVGGDVHLLDATMGLQEEDKSDSYYRLFALSPDGKTAACAKPNAIQLRYTATGECWRTIEDSWTDGIAQQEVTALQNVKKDDRRSEYTAMEFAADGKLLALSSASCLKTEERLPLEPLSSQIQIWDLMSGECTYRKTLRRGLTQVEALAFSPDGNMLAVGLTFKIFLLDTATDMYLWEAAPRGFSVPRSFTFFPDDGMLATVYNVSIPYMYEGHNHEIEIWDIATGKLRRRFETNIPDRETYSSPIYLLDGRHLRIDHWGKVRLFQKGERPLSPGANLLKSKQVEYIPSNNGWISSHGRLLFWIPEEYRTHCTSLVCGNTIVLGHGSGLTFVWLDL